MLHLLLLIQSALGLPLPDPTADDPTTLLGPTAFELRLPMDDMLQTALADREHENAISALMAMDTSDFSGRQIADQRFLLAWSWLRTDTPEKAIPFVDHVETNESAPSDYRQLTLGEIHLANGDTAQAATAFQTIDASSALFARAQLQLAAAHHEAGGTKAALDIYQLLKDRPDPTEGNDIALWAVVAKQGETNPASLPYLRRLYSYYPLTQAGKKASSALKSIGSGIRKQDRGERVFRLMERGAWRSVIDTIQSRLGDYPLTSALSCRVRYAYGRSQFKRNQVTIAAQVLKPVGEKCVGLDDTNGPKALYIAGKALERKKEWANAAAVYSKIPDLYPNHSMADDGYTLGGIAWVEAGQPKVARALWARQADAYPTGDMAGEGFWRLAWSSYLSGEPQTAIDWAERMVREVPIHVDPVHVVGAKYWAARWRIHPDVNDPTELNPDAEAVEEGISKLTAVYTDHPMSFYSLHAVNRLRELDPSAFSTLNHPEPIEPRATWTVRQAFIEHPAAQRALSLNRLGLAREAQAELRTLGTNLTPSEKALSEAIRAQFSPYTAHDKLHKFLHHHPPSTLGVDKARILDQAYPDHYWDLLQSVASDYRFDPRIFHALVREESSFNKDIRSWAGAKGLSQLMPATARRVAKWLGKSVSSSTIKNPELNLAIGSRYLHYLFGYFDGNPFLSVAAYNAGEGNVGRWVARFGEIPSDEFVEHIPFRETRHYVKRVLGTYQTYRVIRGPAQAPSDWTKHNHKARRTPN